MTMIRNLYYAMWANLSMFSLATRAAIVLAALVVLLWLIVRPLLFRILVLLLRLAALLVKLTCLLGGKLLGITAKRSPGFYAACYNRLVGLLGRCNERLLKWSEQLGGKRKLCLGWMLLLYGILMLLVTLPHLLESVISEEYLPYFSAVSILYQRIEAPALETAAAYSPLFSVDYDVTVEESAFDEEPAPEVWLSLSTQGRNGSNLRAGPDKKEGVLTVVVGDTQVLYLNERNGRWVHVRTEDGLEGWIYDSLITGIPDEAPE